MRKLRDVFYINAYPEKKEIVYYGMEFSEFVKHSPTVINKLLLIKGNYMNSTIMSNTGFEIVDEADIDNLLKMDC